MTLGELREEIKIYESLPDDTIILAGVEDDSGNFVDQDVRSGIEPWTDPRGATYLYIKTKSQ